MEQGATSAITPLRGLHSIAWSNTRRRSAVHIDALSRGAPDQPSHGRDVDLIGCTSMDSMADTV
jgi:hypothetical protein